MAARITRAKKALTEANVPFEIPVGEEVAKRLDSVLEAVYWSSTRATPPPLASGGHAPSCARRRCASAACSPRWQPASPKRMR